MWIPSLPNGSASIYGIENDSAIAVMPYGSGSDMVTIPAPGLCRAWSRTA